MSWSDIELETPFAGALLQIITYINGNVVTVSKSFLLLLIFPCAQFIFLRHCCSNSPYPFVYLSQFISQDSSLTSTWFAIYFVVQTLDLRSL